MPKAISQNDLPFQPRVEPAHPAYDTDGVDRSLVRWMLSLTPTERLHFLQSSLEMLASARPLPDGSR